MPGRRAAPPGARGQAGISNLTICAGVFFGLWITACILFVVRSTREPAIVGDAATAAPSARSASLRTDVTAAKAGSPPSGRSSDPGAPQQALRNAAHGTYNLPGTLVDSSWAPLKKSASKFTQVERVTAARALVERVVGIDAAGLFAVALMGNDTPLAPDTFEISDLPQTTVV